MDSKRALHWLLNYLYTVNIWGSGTKGI